MPERLYIVKNAAGEEFEPADEQKLVRWAESGKIDLDCTVRSTLIPKWYKAIELPFLAPILKARLSEKVEKKNNTLWNRIKTRIFLKVSNIDFTASGLTHQSEAAQPAAGLPLRILAYVTDTIILGIGIILLYLLLAFLFKHNIVDSNSVFYVGFMVAWTATLLYYTLFISLTLQTPGQKCWGIYLVRTDDEQFWCGRAFFYTIFMFLFGIFTPVFILGTSSRRSLQEILTKTKMVRIVIDKNKLKRH